MHLGRFHAVVYDLSAHFEAAELPEKIENCAVQLDQYAATNTSQKLEAFRAAIESLYKAAEITAPELGQPFAQQVISELDLGDVLSPRFKEIIEAAIREGSFNPAGLASDLRKIGKNASKKIGQINAIARAFNELHVEFEEVENETAEVGFLLPREVVGNTLKNLTSEFNNIAKLAQAINELVGATDYDPKVLTIASSWWQVFLELDVGAILVWVLLIERIVILFKSNLEIKRLQQQLSDQKVSQEITDLIENEIERRVSTALQELASELRKSYSKIEDGARLNEVETQLRRNHPATTV